jgi:hypothetical protein
MTIIVILCAIVFLLALIAFPGLKKGLAWAFVILFLLWAWGHDLNMRDAATPPQQTQEDTTR